MSEYRSENRKKRKREQAELDDIYRILELIYHRLSEGKYRSKLSRLGAGYRSGTSKFSQKSNPKAYERSQSYAKPELKYNPKPEKISFGGGKPWSEAEVYRPRERIVYDPEVKSLLQKIEKHLAKALSEAEKDVETRDLDKLDKEELTKLLEESKDPEVLKKLLERELVEINKAEPEPKMYEMNGIDNPESEAAKPETDASEERKLPREPSELQEYLEKVGEEQGMGIVGPFEIEEAEFKRLVDELKRRGAVSGEEWEKMEQSETNEESKALPEKAEQENPGPLPAEEKQPDSESLIKVAESEPEVVEGAKVEIKPEVEQEVEPALEPTESELFDVKPGVLPEDLDDPVFWQKLENEIIEKEFKKPEVKPEPEPLDEY
jgi:hypothetical protein